MSSDTSSDTPDHIEVVFILADGSRRVCHALQGESVLDAALDNLVPGIMGQCGGGCTCCTCHVYVAAPWFEQLPAPHQDELDLLVYAHEVADNSRLACQIELHKPLSGVLIRVPSAQA